MLSIFLKALFLFYFLNFETNLIVIKLMIYPAISTGIVPLSGHAIAVVAPAKSPAKIPMRVIFLNIGMQ